MTDPSRAAVLSLNKPWRHLLCRAACRCRARVISVSGRKASFARATTVPPASYPVISCGSIAARELGRDIKIAAISVFAQQNADVFIQIPAPARPRGRRIR